MSDARKALGNKVRQARLMRGWTQKQLAEMAGVSRGTVSNIERGKGAQDDNSRSTPELAAVLNALDFHLDLENMDAHGPVDPFDECLCCHRIVWPDAYELTFNILGGHLKRMHSDAERLTWMRKMTAPIANKEEII